MLHKVLPLLLCATAFAAPAAAKTIETESGVSFTPILDLRLRYENVDQDNALANANALTARARGGFEVKKSGFALLAEAEGTLAISEKYNSTTNGNVGRSVVADPENVELNRLQLQYTGIEKTTLTGGRQRINMNDQRFVGSVGWRDNEQTFDAVRLETKALGPVMIDVAYAWSERSIFGSESGSRQAFSGDMILLNGGVKLGPVSAVAFGYLIEQEERAALSSKTFGARASGDLPLGDVAKLSLVASYANQTDYKNNPFNYSADYILAEAKVSVAGFGLTAGYEELGSDGGVAAFQTPLATLHKFQGWADMFLTTPAAGIRDYYGGLSYKFAAVKALPGLNASVTYHKFDSDVGNIDYGSEWDAVIGFKVKGVGVAVKYANYNADAFAVDTEKFWLQLEWSL